MVIYKGLHYYSCFVIKSTVVGRTSPHGGSVTVLGVLENAKALIEERCVIVCWGEGWLLEQIPALLLGSLQLSVTWRPLVTSIMALC